MICSDEASQFVPYGQRLFLASVEAGTNLGSSGGLQENNQMKNVDKAAWQSNQPLLNMFKEFNLRDQKDKCVIRQQPCCDEASEEELYIVDKTVYWSRGVSGPTPQLIRSFTMKSPVIEAIWCDFVLPLDSVAEDLIQAEEKPVQTRNTENKSDRNSIGSVPRSGGFGSAGRKSTMSPLVGGGEAWPKRLEEESGVEIQRCVCIREIDKLTVFCEGGRDYICALPFMVKRMWKVENGLLFERDNQESNESILHQETPFKRPVDPPRLAGDVSTTAVGTSVDQSSLSTIDGRGTAASFLTTKLSVLFSVFHPLDELSPVLCRTGGSGSSAKVSFVTESSQRIVHTSDNPSLVYTYDRQLGLHSIWRLRVATVEEIETTCSRGYDIESTVYDTIASSYQHTDTPGGGTSQSISQSMSRFTVSTSQSPSMESPMRSYMSRVQSPLVSGPGVGGVNRRQSLGVCSPSVSRLITIKSRSPIPGAITGSGNSSGLLRLHNPSPPTVQRPTPHTSPHLSLYESRNPASPYFSEMMGQTQAGEMLNPLLPEVCIDHVWTETYPSSRDGAYGAASKVFDTVDISGQCYTCFHVKYHHQLRCVKREESNDGNQLIYGSISLISALDALPLETRSMLLILDLSHNIVLYTGTQKMMKLHIHGLPNTITTLPTVSQTLVGGAETSARPIGSVLGRTAAPNTATPRFRPGAGRGAGVLDTKLYEELAMLSPVPTDLNDSTQGLNVSLLASGDVVDDFHNNRHSSFTAGNTVVTSQGAVVALSDNIRNRFSVELSDGSMYRTSLPELSNCPIVSHCLEALRQMLPRDTALETLSRWFCVCNAPGSKSINQSEWSRFSTFVLNTVVNQTKYHVEHDELMVDFGLVGSPPSTSLSCEEGSDENTNNNCGADRTGKKKPRIASQGTDEDWQYLLNSQHHHGLDNELKLWGLHPNLDHNQLLSADEMKESKPATGAAAAGTAATAAGSAAMMYKHQLSVLFALHLVYEELKLDSVLQKNLEGLAKLLYKLARNVKQDQYVEYYRRDFPSLFKESSAAVDMSQTESEGYETTPSSVPPFFTQAPPSIYHWLEGLLLTARSSTPNPTALPSFPCLTSVSTRCQHVITIYALLTSTEQYLNQFIKLISIAGRRPVDFTLKLKSHWSPNSCPSEKIVLYMSQIDKTMRVRLTDAVMVVLLEAADRCRNSPPHDWPHEAYELIGRDDLAYHSYEPRGVMEDGGSLRGGVGRKAAVDLCGTHVPTYTTAETAAVRDVKEELGSEEVDVEEDDGTTFSNEEVLKLRFRKDLRVREVRRLLQSAQPVRVALTQRPETSDHEFIEEQEKHLYAMCIRTMALSVGRGMLTLCSHSPLPTEPLDIPKLCLTGRAPPRNTTVDLTHIDVPANMNRWPQFHNGVAAGLRISKSSKIEASWILYNKAQSSSNAAAATSADGNSAVLTKEHAGFLLGQGLNGHLDRLATLNIHDYLVKCHEMTSMALLLGIAANKRGTMDMTTTKMLSIHIAALLPPTSTELDVSHTVQVAAVVGVGLVYMNTAHRHIAEVLLSEIGRPPGPESENCQDRESYSLAAGLALGFVMLEKGGSEVLGMTDLALPEQLYHYMVGGHKKQLTVLRKEGGGASQHHAHSRPQCYQIKEGDYINVNVTGPGATLALGLMFFNSNSTSIADWMLVPDTQSLLDSVRPDHLTLRVIARGLIIWSKVEPTDQWINSHLPKIICTYAFNRVKYQNDQNCSIDFETMSQAYCSVVAGACMVIGLKYASSCDAKASGTLFTVLMRLLNILSKPSLVEQAGKTTVENSLMVALLSLSMVMAGSGDLTVLQICRHLRSRVGPHYPHVLYGSHMVISMSIGLMFLGAGRYALSTSAESVAVMLCAFFPKFPNHSNDNRYHLQALRHLYVLAVEKRLVLPRDVMSGYACYLPLRLTYQDGSRRCINAPCLLPELKFLTAVEVRSPRYWPISFSRKSNWIELSVALNYYRPVGMTLNCYLRQKGHPSLKNPPNSRHVFFIWTCLSKLVTFVYGENGNKTHVVVVAVELLSKVFLRKLLSKSGMLGVKLRAGYLPYADDPKGYKSVMAQSLNRDRTFGKILQAKDIHTFTNNLLIRSFSQYFCTSSAQESFNESLMTRLCLQTVSECLAQDKLQILHLLLSLHMEASRLASLLEGEETLATSTHNISLSVSLWQLRLLLNSCGQLNEQLCLGLQQQQQQLRGKQRDKKWICLVGKELLVLLKSSVDNTFHRWMDSGSGVRTLTKYFTDSACIEWGDSSVQDVTLLSAFLSWYNIPDPRALSDLGLSVRHSFPTLYRVLRSSGMSVSSVMSLSAALSHTSSATSPAT